MVAGNYIHDMTNALFLHGDSGYSECRGTPKTQAKHQKYRPTVWWSVNDKIRHHGSGGGHQRFMCMGTQGRGVRRRSADC